MNLQMRNFYNKSVVSHEDLFLHRGKEQLGDGLFQPTIREDSDPDPTLHLAMVLIRIAYLHNQKESPEIIASTPVFSVNRF